MNKEDNENITKLLNDILDSLKRLVFIFGTHTKESFLSEKAWMAQDSASKRLMIIGEASSRLMKKYPEFCKKYLKIPFREIIGMRNIIVHEYSSTQWEAVWDTMENDVPQLYSNVEKAMDILNKQQTHIKPRSNV